MDADWTYASKDSYDINSFLVLDLSLATGNEVVTEYTADALNSIHDLWLLWHGFACLICNYILASIYVHCPWLHLCLLFMFVVSSSLISIYPIQLFWLGHVLLAPGRGQLLTQQSKWCTFVFAKLRVTCRGRSFLHLLFPSDTGSLKILSIFILYCSLSTNKTPSFHPITWFSQPYESQVSGAFLPSNNPINPSAFCVKDTKLHVKFFWFAFILSSNILLWIPSVNDRYSGPWFIKPRHPLM